MACAMRRGSEGAEDRPGRPVEHTTASFSQSVGTPITVSEGVRGIRACALSRVLSVSAQVHRKGGHLNIS